MKKTIKKYFNIFGLDIKKYHAPNYKWITEKNIKTVLDIGANTGQFAEYINSIIPDVKIFSFEPIKICYNELVKKNRPNLTAFNFALGDNNYSTSINVSSHTPSSSLLKMKQIHKDIFPYTSAHTTETISVKRLDDISNEINLLPNILVKIDVQGYEDKVILGGLSTLKKTSILIIEINYKELYENQPLFEEISSILYENGFLFKGNLDQVIDPLDGSILYSNSVFVK